MYGIVGVYTPDRSVAPVRFLRSKIGIAAGAHRDTEVLAVVYSTVYGGLGHSIRICLRSIKFAKLHIVELYECALQIDPVCKGQVSHSFMSYWHIESPLALDDMVRSFVYDDRSDIRECARRSIDIAAKLKGTCIVENQQPFRFDKYPASYRVVLVEV